MGFVDFDTRVNKASGICPDFAQSVRPKSICIQLFLLSPDTIRQGAWLQCFRAEESEFKVDVTL